VRERSLWGRAAAEAYAFMRQAASFDHVSLDLFLSGKEISTGPADYEAICRVLSS
jgi:hypothetical protein